MSDQRKDFDADEHYDKELLRTMSGLREPESNTTPINEFNRNHPELAEDEVWLTNSSDEVPEPSRHSDDEDGHGSRYDAIAWDTKRKGTVSYDSKGKVLGDKWKGSFPVFIKQSEMAKTDPARLLRMLPDKS